VLREPDQSLFALSRETRFVSPHGPAILLLAAAALSAQSSGQQPKQPAPREPIPASYCDDVRGYNDRPQLRNQKWKVHDMERPRIVLFDGIQ
jgi:hypothetical protein